MNEYFSPYEEFQEKFFPENILFNLEREIYKLLDLNIFDKNSLRIDNNNEKTGIIEIKDIFLGYNSQNEKMKKIEELVSDFYKSRDYKTCIGIDIGIVFAKKDKERYSINIAKGRESYFIFISEPEKPN